MGWLGSDRGVGRPSASPRLVLRGVIWTWRWLDTGTGEVYGRMTQPVPCCPDCRRPLRVADSRSRVVRRPAWPTILSCSCGFFRGFRLPPEELIFLAYREVNRLHGAVEPEPAACRDETMAASSAI